MNNRIVAIVDAYSTGAELAPLFAKYGYQSVHVQSSRVIPADFIGSFRPGDFKDHIAASTDDWDLVLKKLAPHRPAIVIPGTETGVILADFLSSKLNLPGNDPSTSALRRDKFEMQEALRRAGLASIAQHRAATADEALEWSRKFGRWPLVVKPLDSAGADGVSFCYNEDEVHAAVGRIVGRTNRIGIDNRGVLLQERLVGRQYFMNAVSIDGLHKITEIWADDKSLVDGAALICDKEELLPYNGATQSVIKPYVEGVLTALGVRNGPSHSELMLTDHGPVLIETAARMQGTILHEAVAAAIGSSHVTTTVDRYLNPETFKRHVNEAYELGAVLYCVTLQSSLEGIVRENRVHKLVSTLPSFFSMFHTPEHGERIHRTTDLFSNPGIIYLLHQNRAQLECDYAKIRAWEAAGELFAVEAA